jgi:hypothetical protein
MGLCGVIDCMGVTLQSIDLCDRVFVAVVAEVLAIGQDAAVSGLAAIIFVAVVDDRPDRVTRHSLTSTLTIEP